MAYIDSKRTRVWVHPTWRVEDGAPTVEDLVAEGWKHVGGVRSDQAQTTPNVTQQYHYGENTPVSSASPPDRTITLPASEDLDNDGQKILRWADLGAETVGVLLLKDGTNGFAVEATVVVNDESGDAQGGLRATGFTITPISERVSVGNSGIYEPTP